jgi:hypothetical protein
MEQHSIKTPNQGGICTGEVWLKRSVCVREIITQGIKLKHQTRQSDANARPQRNFTKEKIVFVGIFEKKLHLKPTLSLKSFHTLSMLVRHQKGKHFIQEKSFVNNKKSLERS